MVVPELRTPVVFVLVMMAHQRHQLPNPQLSLRHSVKYLAELLQIVRLWRPNSIPFHQTIHVVDMRNRKHGIHVDALLVLEEGTSMTVGGIQVADKQKALIIM